MKKKITIIDKSFTPIVVLADTRAAWGAQPLVRY